MAMLKGQYQGLEISEDGSSIKLRLSDGSAKFAVNDWLSLTHDFVSASAAAKLASTARRSGTPTRYDPLPAMLLAADVNLNAHREDGSFSIEFADAKNRRTIVVVNQDQAQFLLAVFSGKKNPPPEPQLH